MAEDHYKILGVRRGASQDEILKAYREAARRCHPDLHPEDERATSKFYRVQAAFEVLSDPEKRRAYHRCQAPWGTARPASFEPGDWRDSRDSYGSLSRYATTEVAEPAMGLAVATALAIGLQYLAFFDGLLQAGVPAAKVPPIIAGTLGVLINLVGCILGVVVLLGAIQMRKLENYRFVVAASILATLCCFSPWFLLAMPFGIWALVVLCNQQVKDAFWS